MFTQQIDCCLDTDIRANQINSYLESNHAQSVRISFTQTLLEIVISHWKSFDFFKKQTAGGHDTASRVSKVINSPRKSNNKITPMNIEIVVSFEIFP